MSEARRLQRRLTTELSGAWRDSFDEVARHNFLPESIWIRGAGGRPVPVNRATDAEGWWEACYSDAPIAVQLDDGDGSGRGNVTSTSSMPSVVARMLDSAGLSAGLNVLEIGTGTGFNAALLASIVGPENVATVEIDPRLSASAAVALQKAGWPVRTVVGDGEKGSPRYAPFDRILATAAVRTVPYAWVEQTRAGGLIITPFCTSFHRGALLHLRADAIGRASGRFGGDAAFMWTRTQRPPRDAVRNSTLPDPADDVDETSTDLHPREPVEDFDASFAIGLHVPGMAATTVDDELEPDSEKGAGGGAQHGAAERYTVYLMAPESRSWASWHVEPGAREYPVRQYGPRRLFDELEKAYRWWMDEGRPSHDRFGVNVGPEGQSLWLDVPEHVLPFLGDTRPG